MRTFKLVNDDGNVCDITTQDLFFHNPSGLGYSYEYNYRRIGNRFVAVNRQSKQDSITGIIALLGDDPYNSYFQLVQFLSKVPLVLQYVPNNEGGTTPAGTVYSRDVVVSKLEKTELTMPGYLDCSITLDALGPWYEDVTINNGLGDNNDNDQLVWGYGTAAEFLHLGNIVDVHEVITSLRTSHSPWVVLSCNVENNDLTATTDSDVSSFYVEYPFDSSIWRLIPDNYMQVSCRSITASNSDAQVSFRFNCSYLSNDDVSVDMSISLDPDTLSGNMCFPRYIEALDRKMELRGASIYLYVDSKSGDGLHSGDSVTLHSVKVEPYEYGGRAIDKTAMYWSGENGVLKFGPKSEWEEGIYCPGNSNGPSRLVINGPMVNPLWTHYVDGVAVSTGRVDDTIPAGMQLVVDNISIPGRIYKQTISGSGIVDIYDKSDFSTERFVSIRPGRNKIIVRDQSDNYGTPKVGIEWEGHVQYESV